MVLQHKEIGYNYNYQYTERTKWRTKRSFGKDVRCNLTYTSTKKCCARLWHIKFNVQIPFEPWLIFMNGYFPKVIHIFIFLSNKMQILHPDVASNHIIMLLRCWFGIDNVNKSKAFLSFPFQMQFLLFVRMIFMPTVYWTICPPTHIYRELTQ